MGSGKTAVGKSLARLLGLPFYDSDTEIERRTGVDISFIFEKKKARPASGSASRGLSRLSPQWMESCLPQEAAPYFRPRNRRHLASRGWGRLPGDVRGAASGPGEAGA